MAALSTVTLPMVMHEHDPAIHHQAGQPNQDSKITSMAETRVRHEGEQPRKESRLPPSS
jgi:hypothetical protein